MRISITGTDTLTRQSNRRAVLDRALLLLLVLVCFHAGGCNPDDSASPVLQDPGDLPFEGPALRVALVRYAVGADLSTQVADLTAKIQAITEEVGPLVDVIVTPEYGLTSSVSSAYPDYAIDFACDSEFNNCVPSAGGGARSGEVVAAIEAFRARAVADGYHLYLGTVVERFDASAVAGIPDEFVYFNTLVIIDPQGGISIKRKTNGDWFAPCMLTGACAPAIEAEALRTVRATGVLTRLGDRFEIFPIICGERAHTAMLDHAVTQGIQGVDVVIGPEREGDLPYEDLTRMIQGGNWSVGALGWDDGIRTGFIDSYIGTGIARSGAYLAAAEGAFGGAALIQLAAPPAPVDEYVLRPDYMFGTIRK